MMLAQMAHQRMVYLSKMVILRSYMLKIPEGTPIYQPAPSEVY